MPSEPNSENQLPTLNEGLIKNKYESIFKEIQGIISIFYILAVAIGMLFNYQKYSEFGINIFDYADIFEFLVTPFSDITVLFFTFITCLICYFTFLFDSWTIKKYPKFYSKIVFGFDKKEWYNSFRYFTFLIVFFLYLYYAADFYGKLALDKTQKQTPISLRFVDNELKKGIMIGKTKEIIFLLEGEKVKVIPFNALVKEFEIKR